MSVQVDPSDQAIQTNQSIAISPSCKHSVSEVRTAKVTNVSLSVSETDIKDFFSFAGDIQYVEMQRETDSTRVAYVTFKNSQGADSAIVLGGATIGDLNVAITPAVDYELPPDAPPNDMEKSSSDAAGSAVTKAEVVVSTVLAKGVVLGKDALSRAKTFDERHKLTSSASARVASIDQKIGLTRNLSMGKAVVNEKVREMNERYQVTEKTKSVLTAAEQKASSASSVIMSNPYVSTGASWVTNAFSAVAKAAEDVTIMTKEKVGESENDRKTAQ